ncbi:hypothetical protein D3C72_1009930 [compost metagenome]
MIPARLIRSNAPIHNDKSGFTGFLTNTGISTPCKASAISCTVNGLAVERAPTHSTSTPAAKASSTCFAVATSVAVNKPVSSFALFNHSKPIEPIPSNSPGRVRGFQIPARKIFTFPVFANKCAVDTNCSSVSALQGPAIIKGLSPVSNQDFKGVMSNVFFMLSLIIYFNIVCVNC